jgi:hypothetical protein
MGQPYISSYTISCCFLVSNTLLSRFRPVSFNEPTLSLNGHWRFSGWPMPKACTTPTSPTVTCPSWTLELVLDAGLDAMKGKGDAEAVRRYFQWVEYLLNTVQSLQDAAPWHAPHFPLSKLLIDNSYKFPIEILPLI